MISLIQRAERAAVIGCMRVRFSVYVRYLLPGGWVLKADRHQKRSRSMDCTSSARLEVG